MKYTLGWQAMRLEDVAKVCRTKNAGAFLMTIDLIFEDADVFELAKRRLTPAMFASLYQVPLDRVEVSSWDQLRAIKATVRVRSQRDRPVTVACTAVSSIRRYSPSSFDTAAEADGGPKLDVTQGLHQSQHRIGVERDPIDRRP